MNIKDVFRLDATAQAELVARKELTALELVDAAIEHVERMEPVVHALASSDFERARRRAREPIAGPFAGVPFLLKDLLSYPGLPHQLGSRLFRQNLANAGSPYAQQIDAAGLIPLGKTTISEFGLLGSTETLLSGTTCNPWNLERSAMGSSGGSAAAVATGMVPFAHASDGGGSIRIPASAHGLFGFKPSRGRCLSAGPNDMWGLLIEHCVSRSVRDSARFLSLTADPASSLQALGSLERRQRKLRIGYYGTTSMGRSSTPEVASLLERAAQLCASLGHEVEAVQAPAVDGPALSRAFFVLAGAGMSGLEQMMQPMFGRPLGEQELEPFTLELIGWFRGLPPESMECALKDIEREGQAMRAYAERFDAVLCPTMPAPAPVLGTFAPTKGREELVRLTEDLAGYTALYTMGGLPAMSVPLYHSAQGLPIGMHFAARLGDEATLFSLAYQLEEAAPWAARWPALVA